MDIPIQQNILYISYDGMTDQLGQSQVLPYICGLSKRGFRFHLISCEKPDRLQQQRHIIERICGENNITWHPLPYTKTPPVLSTIKDIRAIRKKAFELQQEYKFRLVHCRGYISSIIGLEMKRKFHTGFLFDMRGLWADEKVDAGSWSLKNPLYKFVYRYFKKKEKQFLEEADHTISLTHAGAAEIHSWKNIANNPVPLDVIPCCADLDFFNPAIVDPLFVNSLWQELKLQEHDQVLTYLGSIGSWYMLNEMLDFFVCYLRVYPRSKFLFITMDQHEEIRAQATARNVEKQIIIRPALRHEVPSLLSLVTHSVFFIRPTYSKISSSPTKQAELMGMGIPVICNDGVGDTGSIVTRFNSGVAINAFNEQAYNAAIARLSQHIFDPQKIRQGAFSYFSLAAGVDRYGDVYKKICS